LRTNLKVIDRRTKPKAYRSPTVLNKIDYFLILTEEYPNISRQLDL
jgi:hypothetical protein